MRIYKYMVHQESVTSLETKLTSRSIKVGGATASLPTKKMTRKSIIIDLAVVCRRFTAPVSYEVPQLPGAIARALPEGLSSL